MTESSSISHGSWRELFFGSYVTRETRVGANLDEIGAKSITQSQSSSEESKFDVKRWGATLRNTGLLLSIITLAGIGLTAWVSACKTMPLKYKLTTGGLTAASCGAAIVCFQSAVNKFTPIEYKPKEPPADEDA